MIHMRRAVELLPFTKIANIYGPTESTTFTTFYPVTTIPTDAKSIPIGKAITNTRLYVLDENYESLPMGVIGELYIGGDGLAKGYLHAEEQTKNKFVKNLQFLPPHERLYKTGDLVRFLPDGNLDFMGRVDNQVKINGFRIELEEIEHHLNAHPKVKQAIVVVKKHDINHNKLIAYLIARHEDISLRELKDYLRAKLPHYMIPSFIYNLTTLPLTPNGKVNRKELESMEAV